MIVNVNMLTLKSQLCANVILDTPNNMMAKHAEMSVSYELQRLVTAAGRGVKGVRKCSWVLFEIFLIYANLCYCKVQHEPGLVK